MANLHTPLGFAWHVAERTGRVDVVKKGSSRKKIMLHREDADREFHGAGGAQHVPVLSLGTADRYPIGNIAQCGAQGRHFHRITGRCCGGMGAYVGQVGRTQSGIAQGTRYGGGLSARMRGPDMVAIAGDAVTGKCRMDARTPR